MLNVRGYAREQRLRAELERLDEYRSEVIATISHELKNPIGVIQGHLELLEGSVGDGAAHSLRAIGRGADRLATLANGLLVLSRVGGDPAALPHSFVDLEELAREGLEFARITAERRGVELRLAVTGDGGFTVLGHRDSLVLVVTNLISNAIKYSDAGDRVEVSLRRSAGRVQLACADTGIGISSEDQQRLFGEFFRSTLMPAPGPAPAWAW